MKTEKYQALNKILDKNKKVKKDFLELLFELKELDAIMLSNQCDSLMLEVDSLLDLDPDDALPEKYNRYVPSIVGETTVFEEVNVRLIMVHSFEMVIAELRKKGNEIFDKIEN